MDPQPPTKNQPNIRSPHKICYFFNYLYIYTVLSVSNEFG